MNVDMRDEVWFGILDSAKYVRYYSLLARKYGKRHFWSSVILTLAACGAVAPLVGLLTDFVSVNSGAIMTIILFVVVAVVTVITHYAGFAAKATAARLFSDQFQYLEQQWRTLWYGDPNEQQVQALRNECIRLVSGFELPVDDNLNDKAESEVYDSVPNDFRSGD